MKLAILRLTQQKSKTINDNEAKKREVAGLLRDGQEHKAEIKATSIIMNDYRVEVYTQLIIYLNLLSVRYELLLSQHACPAELKEACCAIVYASPHLSEQTELAVCRVMLLARFGKQFPNQCTDEQAIHPKITTRLSARTPDQTVVNYYVTSIAREFNIDVTPHNGGDGGDDDNDNNNDDGNIFAGGNSGGHVINDAIIPCSHSRVLSPIDPTKGMAYGPGLQDGVAGIPSRFTIDLSQCGSVDSNRERISVLVSGPEETHIFGEVAPNGDGTFAASYVPPLAGAYAVAVYCGERPIGDGKPWVLCVRDAATPADPRMCRAIGSGLLGGVAGVPSTFTIFAHSGDGRECSGGGEAFSVFVSGPGNVRIRGDVVDNNDGTYTATYTPPVPGQYALAVYAGKSPIGNGEPWLFDVSAASSLGPSSSTSTSLPSAELDPAKCYAEGPGLRSPAAGALATFTVMAVGTDGALRSAGGDRFAVLISGPNGARLTGDVCDNGDGTYTATYTPPVAGTYAVAVYANAATMIGNGQPIIVNVNGGGMASKKKGACAEKCTAEGEGLVEGAVGKLACFEIHAIDEDGVPCRTGGEDFSVFVSGPDGSNVQLRGEVLDNDDGTYVVTYTPPVEGLYSIAIMLGTDPIGSGSAYNAMIVGDPSAKKDSGSGEDEEDDLMARFAMLKAGNATEGAAAAGGITGFDSGDVSMELPPSTPSTSSFGNDDDELMAKLNALKGGAPSSLGSETTMRQSGCGNEGSAFGDEDELMAKFNALKDSETPMGQVGGGNSGEEQTLFGDDEDELMAKFNALKGGEVPLSEEHDMGQAAPIEHQTEAAAAAATGSGVSGGIGDGEDDDIMARFNMLKNAESPIDSSSSSSGSVLFPPSSIPSVIVPPPQPQPQKVSTLPDVPISSLFAVRVNKVSYIYIYTYNSFFFKSPLFFF